MTEQLGTEVVRPNSLSLEAVNPEMATFSQVDITKVNDELPWKPPVEVSVTLPDGRVAEGVDAATPVYAFKDQLGNDLSVSIATAGHIDSLHIKGIEAGSKFDYDSLGELFADMAPKIPAEVATSQDEVSAFSMDMGKHMGQEGIATMDELVSDGVLDAGDIETVMQTKEGVIELNHSGTEEEKAAFVEEYRKEHPDAKIQFQLIRGGVIVPIVDGPKRDTNELFVVFGPGQNGKTMYTAAPGRFMPKHPNPDQHRDDTGSINESTFSESADAWFNTVMLTGKPIEHVEDGQDRALTEGNETSEDNETIKPLDVRFDAKTGTLLLGIGDKEMIDPGLLEATEPEGFKPKDELHLTIIGFKQGKLLKAAMKANPELATKIEELATAAEWGIKPTGERYKLSKLYEGEEAPRESIIEMLQCPGAENFFASINELTGLELQEQPPHVTLLTKGNPQGIGITTAQEIIELGERVS